jgi:hypothetical protein
VLVYLEDRQALHDWLAAIREAEAMSDTVFGPVMPAPAPLPFRYRNPNCVPTPTFMLAQGVDMKIVQATLRRSRMSTTADLYTHVLAEVQRAGAARMDSSRPSPAASSRNCCICCCIRGRERRSGSVLVDEPAGQALCARQDSNLQPLDP